MSKTLILTGSSSGIGQALTSHLLAQGHTVYGLARRKQTPRPGFFPYVCDLTVWAQCQLTLEAITTHHQARPIDAVILLAATQGEIDRFSRSDPGRWLSTVQDNLAASVYPLRAYAQSLSSESLMIPRIILFSGGGATQARPHYSAYGCAKTAIVRLTETLALEEPTWRVNCIAPGAIRTAMTAQTLALGPRRVGAEEYVHALEVDRTGGASLERVASVVDDLLRDPAPRITGRLIAAAWDEWRSWEEAWPHILESQAYLLRRQGLPPQSGRLSPS